MGRPTTGVAQKNLDFAEIGGPGRKINTKGCFCKGKYGFAKESFVSKKRRVKENEANMT